MKYLLFLICIPCIYSLYTINNNKLLLHSNKYKLHYLSNKLNITIKKEYYICNQFNGLYYFSNNTIFLCKNLTIYNYMRTLQHELVHALQDCNTGLHTKTFKKLGISYSNYTKNLVDTYYSKPLLYRELEYEAFTMQYNYKFIKKKLIQCYKKK